MDQPSAILRDHGGRLEAAARRHGIPVDQWLDLSTGINPLPYPPPDLPADAWHRLPEAGAEATLRAAAARHVGAAGPEGLVPAPGTQALIQWLPRLRPPGARVAVVSPTYNEHAAAWAEAGHAVRPVAGPEDAGPDDDVLVVVNPNNPDGRRWTAPVLRDAAARLGGPDPLLVADEAFADPDATPTLADGENPRLLALRSFGKFFGLAGLRLGIAVTTSDRARTLRHALGPWCVSGPALAVGAAAYGDGDWIAATRARLAADAVRLDGLLTGAGLAVAGGTALFRLAHADDANALAHRLADQGILVRAFPYSGQWVRFGLPGPDADWDRLAAAL